ncbi:carbamoyltransferase HypF [Clostridium beijerinckii]|jgi:[NiFe] hydrogenase maturation protein HypF|uniref:Carbamoyltransferase n=2 Tax=Clostridium beijerinckii TaxID=1520 RepID=A0AAE2UWR4_CLOBE|nr:carbamoyltransferase HypF [Clostridium beijerinckii]ABR35148.1 (NiFe) hydrogenase maturation protein HypF [Clostridium beijerinckii NCIMB 8052]AIU04091.1 (NiFe) hydrogenase maturation protein HypF [Clostridium beijerinckii ATCC 35702]MBF7810219.1 carbamoyltransferase HypF [Clostridium beijerinckii]NOW90861.1 hydrogenase maturation protein HypF [Clostridium beijerinckii]NRT23462.1 hydrogenase maturation protein HypF [Clostridium beijerinckii]
MRYIIKIYGIVQGVGFRPFVYEKARDFKIRGSVQNIGGAVVIDCLGERENIKRFMFNVIKRPPSIAKIERVECTLIKKDLSTISCLDENEFIIKENIDKKFVIKESAEQKNEMRFVSPDIAVCDECLEDIRSKGNLRYKYAFTNCTQCGPRYSIIKALPYDRQNTTMKEFYMCEECKDEYENPLSRRFHAQPNCCEKCGPKLFLTNNRGDQVKCEDPIKETISLIEEGKILAIKGIGGFHLVCDGRNEQAINLLRSRKQRKDKPLALMAKDIGVIKEICYISDKEEEVISSNKRPIVILKKKYPFVLPEAIAPKQNSLGVMLPYTPLHYLLFNEKLDLLVMTSGNISSMPMEYKNEEALKHLNTVADYFLMNDRAIYVQVDDSVVKVIGQVEKVIRGSRGYRPYSLKAGVKNEIIAVGGQQKSTICVSKNGYAYLSQYLGDLGEFNCYKNFKYVLKHICNLFDINSDVLAYDMHPAYSSTKYAKEKKMRKIEVQHHHAHMVSCMAEHSIYDSVIGIIFDGTGFGLDGAVWGGEFLVGNRRVFKRAGQLKYVNLQGGEQAIKEPWRCASSYLYALGYDPEKIIQGVDNEKIKVVKQALDSKINCFVSSSVGRLFDTVAALCGIRNSISYDGQAAIELENIIDYKIKESYSWDIKEENGIFNIQYKSIIEGILGDIQKKELISKISSKFHNSLIKASCDLVCKLREKEHIDKVVLSGGVFENHYLLKGIYVNLIKQGFKVFYNEQIPTNDEGISFGQLHVANAILEKK